jgi:hypothetical protein
VAIWATNAPHTNGTQVSQSDGGNASTWIALFSLLISLSTAIYTHHDRWLRLRLRFMGGDYIEIGRERIRANLLIFNPSSRPNCVTRILLTVSDGCESINLYSDPSILTLSDDDNPRKTNWIPTNIGVGCGTELEVLGWDYKASKFSSNCTFTVTLSDVFGNSYKLEHEYTNKWPKELFSSGIS